MTTRPKHTPAYWASHSDPCDSMMPPPVDYVPDAPRARRDVERRAPSGWWIISATVASAIILGAILWATTAKAACNPLNCPPVDEEPNLPVVPLPATVLLLGGAVALLVWRARK